MHLVIDHPSYATVRLIEYPESLGATMELVDHDTVGYPSFITDSILRVLY